MQHVREILDRISSIVGRQGDANLAEELGVQRTTVSSWKSRGKIPYEECWQVAQKSGVSMDWLLSGTGPRHREQNMVASENGDISFQFGLPEGVVGVPLMDVAASAGDGSFIDDENVTDLIFFDESWLWQTYHLRPKNLRILPVIGNSMEPTLRAGEMVLVDLIEDAGRRPMDGIYVIRLDGGILVKQLQSLPGGQIKVSSENTSYDAFMVDLKEDGLDFMIIGRVMINMRTI
jgi:phage repressor protein C with HTH and peptisase S24 domain